MYLTHVQLVEIMSVGFAVLIAAAIGLLFARMAIKERSLRQIQGDAGMTRAEALIVWQAYYDGEIIKARRLLTEAIARKAQALSLSETADFVKESAR